MDYENQTEYNFQVTVTDGKNSATADVKIQLLDVNDNIPFITNFKSTIDIIEGVYDNELVFEFTGNDNDGTSPNNDVEFSFLILPPGFSLISDSVRYFYFFLSF